MYHYHLDEFEIRDGKAHFIRESRPLPKRVALRRFKERIQELACQVGKFSIHRKCPDEFPGGIVVAKNHRLILVVSRCDCGGD